LTFPLAVAATASCPFEREITYGFVLESGTSFPPNGTGESVVPIVVQFVHPDLSAGGAGLRPGDQLLAINETTVSGITVEEAQWMISRISRARIQPLTLVVARGDERRELNLWGTAACRFTVHLVENPTVNALADGDRIYLTTGMLKFAGSDEELAWVLAHELAHNVLGHPQQTRLRGLLNSVLAATTGEIGEGVSRPELEMRADTLASFLLVQAGYDIRKAGMFLRRLALAESSVAHNSFGETHPATVARIAAFEQMVEQIDERMRQGALQRADMRQEQDAAMAGAGPP
jgi:Zn-dependent protease with chaperone function